MICSSVLEAGAFHSEECIVQRGGARITFAQRKTYVMTHICGLVVCIEFNAMLNLYNLWDGQTSCRQVFIW